ncbi:putative transmembrane protein 183BP isoform X2 [Ostrea edulis]|uniref:putative transmembrane protein 183BP isoform X2 n=1 Tax=Ostrea edulis TaxID=37623 RepID=UPI0024AF1C38|nr:putative transmembrane protein 183BP isoform X2 [Ostrea edulis]
MNFRILLHNMKKKFRNDSKPRKSKVRTNQCTTSKEKGIHNDVTISDFADSSEVQKPRTTRVKKAISSMATNIKYQRKDMEMDAEDVSWFDKDLDEFDIDKAAEDSSNQNVEERTEIKPARSSRKQMRKREDSGGHVYPVDLWFTLASYIDPDAVGRFAALCQDSYLVTKTRQFWKNLYTRFCLNSNLPDELQSECLERAQGLRYRVIRALFWSYPLFVSRTTTNMPFENEPYHLKGNRCLFTWCQPYKNVWNFSFKLKKERLSHINKLTTLKTLPGRVNLYDGYCDVHGHEEIDCYVLQVTCQNYQSVSSVMGLVMCNVYLKVSQENRFHCLRLHFDTTMKESTNQNRDVVGDTVILLDRVLNLKVFPWWHSKYPF